MVISYAISYNMTHNTEKPDVPFSLTHAKKNTYLYINIYIYSQKFNKL